ncbi:MAG: hypothetical protein ACFCUU_13480 [Cyclobacteriaceae bacterium]
MNRYLTYILLIMSSVTAFASNPKTQSEKKLHFEIDSKTLLAEDVKFAMVLTDKKGESLINGAEFSFSHDCAIMDLSIKSSKSCAGEYYFLATKTAYITQTRVDFLSPKKLSNIDYIQATLGDYKVSKNGKDEFSVESGIFSPGFNFKLEFKDLGDLSSHDSKLLDFIHGHHQELPRPTLMSVQHNYNYSRVMLHKTTERSVSITCYYPYKEHTTLVINYTLNYLHNVPPKFLGGPSVLEEEIKKGIIEVVKANRAYFKKELSENR